MRIFLLMLLSIFIFIGVYILGVAQNWYGRPLGMGEVSDLVPEKVEAVKARDIVQKNTREALDVDQTKQIVFGDFHVHTSISMDAFLTSLPLMQGEGAHPPADACDFARYCSALDFWSINDHAESITPTRWSETKEMIRQCNAKSGDPANPDMVAYLGWEWTQTAIASDVENNFGHKNVIFLDTEEGSVPTRPIAADAPALVSMQKAKSGPLKYALPALDFKNRQQYYDFERYLRDTPQKQCEKGVPVKDLPSDCMESTKTPAELFSKLREWGFPSMVIPHGNAVGHHSAQGASWMNQLTSGNHDPELQSMIEVYSGHGNSEEYRSWADIELDELGNPRCPEPSQGYVPMCWQAGEVIRKRCLEEGETEAECEARAELTRRYSAEAGHKDFAVVGGSEVKEWLDAGQCQDCFQPVSGLRPGVSVQAALASRNFTEGPGESERFKFAFIASSDNHGARPGTGFKEVGRHNAADIAGPKSEQLAKRFKRMGKPVTSPIRIDGKINEANVKFAERTRSFVYTGGLVAAHTTARDRQSIWTAVKNREVYGTSGPRILLWFDLLEEGGATVPMGAEVTREQSPQFRVRAVGSFKQLPGCPDYAMNGLEPDRLEKLCYGECYNPSNERHRIERIEVVKITPQNVPDENLDALIMDVWKSFDCDDQGQGCSIEFSDEDFSADERDSVYYVRAIQEPTDTINGGNLRCEYDESGQCIKVNPCHIDERTDYNDDCLMPTGHRAWSSPIYIDYAKSDKQ